VILWTRIAPSTESDASNVTVEGTVPVYNHDTETYIEADANPICVEWAVWREATEIRTNETYSGPVVSSGTAYTTGDIDFTVKVSSG
jgi:alkaline phosphatase D